ncbi:ABC transporter ATP-binding protein [Agrococcus baldri]|uniref:ABC transporter ATP-binding protein n=1 Tax=Agrococcus baldri TaxID=153730 RepID=UPI001649DFDC|nr:ABC transporter ATP-binding protein [Agrococcus baldri]
MIEVNDLKKHFRRRGGNAVTAIDGIDISVMPGEFLVLLGPSGCGKTTLLRCLGGLEQPDEGRISLDGRLVFDSAHGVELPPERRHTSMLFQSYALWPHMTVFDNVAYPLRARHQKSSVIKERVGAVLASVQCEDLADQYPDDISGGQQQRIALARALVPANRVVLFDEPMSNVDAKVRSSLRQQLRGLQREVGFAAVYVTHDQAEALDLADRIAVLRDGSIEQIGSPREIYRRPRSAYVARFVGSVNELQGRVTAIDGTSIAVDTGMGVIHAEKREEQLNVGQNVLVMFRPEAAAISASERPEREQNSWSARVVDQVYQGSFVEATVQVNGVEVKVIDTDDRQSDLIGGLVHFHIDPAHVMLFAEAPESA